MEMNHKKALRHLARRDKVMARLIKKYRLKAIKPKNNYFQSLVECVISQQLSSRAAETITERFINLFGKKIPKPAQVAAVKNQKLRASGLSKQKISYIKNIAGLVEQGGLDFKKLSHATDEEVIQKLIQIKGIGRWTAEMFLMFSLARPDVFSLGDLGLKKAVMRLYKIDTSRHHKKMNQLLSRWKPYGSLAARHLWASIDEKNS